MAIAWEVKITVLDYNQKHVSVTATRTDSADPDHPKTYTIPNTHIDTVGQRAAVLDAIWALRTTDVALEAKIAGLAPTVSALEAAGKANLEAREV